ncbi:MAG: ribonuclease R, partial [Proteobacteria bacterium]|nr:ribonuclease R [Pseudomonadota bacterium]
KHKTAMHSDRVAVRVEGEKRGGKREGSVVRIIERGCSVVVGRYEKGKKFGYLVPGDARIATDIYIPKGADMDAEDGIIAVAELLTFPGGMRSPEGRIIHVIGFPGDPEVEIQSIIIKHGLPSIFPEEVMAAAEKVGDVPKAKELEGRTDLRSLMTVTIDGETARDFDDAVAVKREKDGKIRLWVSIADVSHYVSERGVIDEEAYERGTSVYFPDRCIPMLPERLSNGICSLNPGVDRLTMTAEMLFDASGTRVESAFYNSVIKSDFRLTYTKVKAILVDNDETLVKEYAPVVPDLKLMEELCSRLRSFRRARGCIDFDLPEAQVLLDLQGGIEAIVRSERNLAHMMIEEFMLAANESVATHISDKDLPLLYRVHEEPNEEKMDDFAEFIHNLGYKLKTKGPRAMALSQLLKEVSGKPEERVINHVLLRSMKQAVYSPENTGHFGLAAPKYCHFTSPIRRYPDLVVHRILKGAVSRDGISGKRKSSLQEGMPAVGTHTSRLERRAAEAEREVVAWLKTRFMVDKVGMEFDGFITGVTSFGFFVELAELFVEGLIHVTSLKDDYYIFDEKRHTLQGERNGKLYKIGERAFVKVARVDVEKRQIDFELKAYGEACSAHSGK